MTASGKVICHQKPSETCQVGMDSGETKTCLDVGHTQKDDNIWMADSRVVDVDV